MFPFKLFTDHSIHRNVINCNKIQNMEIYLDTNVNIIFIFLGIAHYN